MGVEEICKEDSTFSESAFLAKVDHVYVMLLTSLMFEKLERVEHKVSPNLYNKYKKILGQLVLENKRQMYDELNVKTSKITNCFSDDYKWTVEVKLIARYLDYIVDRETSTYISGNCQQRTEKEQTLLFEKIKSAKQEQLAKKCPGCGANMDVNHTGKCEYCGTIFNTADYDWILVDIK